MTAEIMGTKEAATAPEITETTVIHPIADAPSEDTQTADPVSAFADFLL